ncbi:MAG: AMP-binding protein [Deltaproteobacteria bacterium]|nr:AMP-binding protein [Deltaproteobacteria bacterium]
MGQPQNRDDRPALPGTEWRIVDISDPSKTIEPGTMTTDDEGHEKPLSGEIAVAGPQVMVGYLNRDDETAETIVAMDGKRWLLTGDIGFMDEHGRVIINDRKKQLIKNRGWSVFPTEVETLMMHHEAVSECAVAGLPDEKDGRVDQGMGGAEAGVQRKDHGRRACGLGEGQHDPLQGSALRRDHRRDPEEPDRQGDAPRVAGSRSDFHRVEGEISNAAYAVYRMSYIVCRISVRPPANFGGL